MRNWTDEKIKEWHSNKFPSITKEGQLNKVQEEILELEQATRTLHNGGGCKEYFEEMADVYISTTGLGKFYPAIARRIKLSLPNDQRTILDKYIDFKMDINIKRKFKETKDGSHHH